MKTLSDFDSIDEGLTKVLFLKERKHRSAIPVSATVAALHDKTYLNTKESGEPSRNFVLSAIMDGSQLTHGR